MVSLATKGKFGGSIAIATMGKFVSGIAILVGRSMFFKFVNKTKNYIFVNKT